MLLFKTIKIINFFFLVIFLIVLLFFLITSSILFSLMAIYSIVMSEFKG